MKQKIRIGIAVITLTMSIQGQVSVGQAGPHFEVSPAVVPYKPSRVKLPPVQPCPDFHASPEKDIAYKVSEVTSPPRPTRLIPVGLTEAGKEAYRNNKFPDPNEVISRISVIVDTQGKPRDPCLVRAAGFDLDQQAAEVAMQYRFKAAEKDGKPVAMRSQIEVRYQTH